MQDGIFKEEREIEGTDYLSKLLKTDSNGVENDTLAMACAESNGLIKEMKEQKHYTSSTNMNLMKPGKNLSRSYFAKGK